MFMTSICKGQNIVNKERQCQSFCCERDGRDGKDGRDGLQGPIGPTGREGLDGKDGINGVDGKNGRDGQPGKNGRNGQTGLPGRDGKDGFNGTKGPQGERGLPGKNGTNGKDGKDGKDASPKNWKECAWNNLSDGRDNGLVKSCEFKKRSSGTYLNVKISSAMRIHACNGCCKRWFVTFDGTECSPVPIDVIVYMENEDGKYGNLHRPRVITGHCQYAKSGSVKVGFHVGNCNGYGNADAYTGYNSSTRIFVEEVDPPQQ